MIAVSQQTMYIDSYKEFRDMLDVRWYSIFKQIDILPVLMPNSFYLAQKICERHELEGIILTGGKDSVERDLVENFLIQHAIDNNLPVLGVCHGMQVIQRFFGVELEEIDNHVCDKQAIFLNDKIIYRNSYHNFGTQNTNIDLVVWARSRDKLVKAIHHKSLPIVGIMWHPERESATDDFDIEIIKNTLQREFECEQLS